MTYLDDLKDPCFDLRREGWRRVVGLHEPLAHRLYPSAEIRTHLAPELWWIPHKQSNEQAILGTEELRMRVLDAGRKVLASQIIEDVDEENHCLSNLREIGWRGLCEKQSSCVKEKVKEGGGEPSEDVVDFCEEGVGTSICAPGTEDGMRGLEDPNVNFEIRIGEGDCQFLQDMVSCKQYNTSDFDESESAVPSTSPPPALTHFPHFSSGTVV